MSCFPLYVAVANAGTHWISGRYEKDLNHNAVFRYVLCTFHPASKRELRLELIVTTIDELDSDPNTLYFVIQSLHPVIHYYIRRCNESSFQNIAGLTPNPSVSAMDMDMEIGMGMEVKQYRCETANANANTNADANADADAIHVHAQQQTATESAFPSNPNHIPNNNDFSWHKFQVSHKKIDVAHKRHKAFPGITCISMLCGIPANAENDDNDDNDGSDDTDEKDNSNPTTVQHCHVSQHQNQTAAVWQLMEEFVSTSWIAAHYLCLPWHSYHVTILDLFASEPGDECTAAAVDEFLRSTKSGELKRDLVHCFDHNMKMDVFEIRFTSALTMGVKFVDAKDMRIVHAFREKWLSKLGKTAAKNFQNEKVDKRFHVSLAYLYNTEFHQFRAETENECNSSNSTLNEWCNQMFQWLKNNGLTQIEICIPKLTQFQTMERFDSI